MITELGIQNFKSWKDTDKLQIAPLTGFFGANSSGKTSLLQTLLMLKQTVERPLDWNGVIDFGDNDSLVNLGSFDDLIHKHNSSSPLHISLSWKLSEKLDIRGTDGLETLGFDLILYHAGNSVSEFGFNYTTGEQKFVVNWDGRGGRINIDGYVHNYGFPFRCYGIKEASGDAMQIFSPLQTQFENLF